MLNRKTPLKRTPFKVKAPSLKRGGKLRQVSNRKPTRPLQNGVKIFADWRERCDQRTEAGSREYKRRTQLMVERQGGKCALCPTLFHEGNPMTRATFDHGKNRGKDVDERLIVDGVWQNAALCWACQGVAGSTRYEWRDGVYQPVRGGE